MASANAPRLRRSHQSTMRTISLRIMDRVQ